jgi:peptidoglycan/xylan/chitin deacetylase (PgdA/CDA1 family)
MHKWDLGDAANYRGERCERDRSWRAWENPPTTRHHLYASLWQLLQPLTEAERQSVLVELQAWSNAGTDSRTTHRTLSVEDVCTLARGELIEIGCHTVTHSILSLLPLASQRNEIHQSKNWLEDVIGRKITTFSYPYGSKRDYTPETVSLVRDAGFACACSTTPTLVTTDSELFELPRLQVKDWDGDEFAYQLSQWFEK